MVKGPLFRQTTESHGVPFFSYLDDNSGMRQIAQHRFDIYKHLGRFAQAILRGPSPLTPAERELIAAYVSALNACSFCHGSHAATAQALGADPGTIEALIEDLDSAPVKARMKPIFRYVKKLTETPSRMVEADAQAVFDAGWDEDALHDVIVVCALFNSYNRIVEGHGIKGRPQHDFPRRGRMLAEFGYDFSDA